jgi:hypothetical protein
MQRRYFNRYIELACPANRNKPILTNMHQQLAETIREHKKIMLQYFQMRIIKTDIHPQLAATLAERKRIMQLLQELHSKNNISPVLPMKTRRLLFFPKDDAA